MQPVEPCMLVVIHLAVWLCWQADRLTLQQATPSDTLVLICGIATSTVILYSSISVVFSLSH